MLYLQFVTLNTSNATDFATELSLREIRHLTKIVFYCDNRFQLVWLVGYRDSVGMG